VKPNFSTTRPRDDARDGARDGARDTVAAQTAPTGPPAPEERGKRDRGFRPDIQGMRAIAVAMVVVYHLWPKVLPGGFAGVDVFFVISGYLITGHMARGFRREGRIRLLDFWGRRARRLLPAVALVLTATWLVARQVLPETQLPNTVKQIRASALYFQNWVLARDNADYLHSADAPTPVQHFWSLSVEEQFYLFWPFLFVLGAFVAWRAGRRAGRVGVLLLALAVFAVSLWWSAHLTAVDPASAYFVTTTRIWELALGGVLTLLPGRLIGMLARQGWLAWIGLVMIVVSAFVLDGASEFPGTDALLPVGGSALLIACGSAAARFGPAFLTSLRPMVFLGDVSYSLYLWHWPIIVLWKAKSGGGIGYLDGPVIAAVSIALAWLTKVLVEDRIRLAPAIARSPGRSLATAITVLIPVVLVAFYSPPKAFSGTVDAKHPGAAVLAGDATAAKGVAPIPSPDEAPLDVDPFSACETPIPSVAPRPCTYGSPAGAKLRVALIGDSVANQYRAILSKAATQRHWYVVTDLHGQCPWTATTMARSGTSDPYTACHDWGRMVLHDMITKYKPDVVVTSERPVLGTPDHPKPDATSFGEIADGMVQYWKQLAAHGIRVVAVRESPEPGRNIPDCLSRPGNDAAACTTPTSKAILTDTALQQAVAKMRGGAELMDLNSLICEPASCPPIIGNVVVYRDTHHLTQTYITSLAPYFLRKFVATKAVRAALR
jgi:peptidoglycan/LPS O-acetylase OafA/YrhL